VVWKDIGKVGSVAGAVFGSSMMFIFPPIMYIGALRKKGLAANIGNRHGKIALNIVLLIAGIIVGLMGTVNSLLALKK
jgi:hypothetical protein